MTTLPGRHALPYDRVSEMRPNAEAPRHRRSEWRDLITYGCTTFKSAMDQLLDAYGVVYRPKRLDSLQVAVNNYSSDRETVVRRATGMPPIRSYQTPTEAFTEPDPAFTTPEPTFATMQHFAAYAPINDFWTRVVDDLDTTTLFPREVHS